MKRKSIVFLALAAFAFGLAQAPQVAFAKGECKADVEKFCKDVPHGKGGIRRCLKQNQDRLSQPCQAKLERAKQRKLACKADKEKFCKDVQPGDGRIKACMKAHESELPQACRAYL